MPDDKRNAPTPGQEANEHGRYGQDLPGAARGDRQKFKDMIEAGQDKKTIVPKSYPNQEAPKTHRGAVGQDDLGLASHSSSNAEEPGAADPVATNPWGNQRANRSATIMGGNPESGHTRSGEGPVWVPIDDDPRSGKSEIRPTALGRQNSTAPDDASLRGQHSNPNARTENENEE